MAKRYNYSLKISGTHYDIGKITDSSTLSIVSPLCSVEKKSAKGTASVQIKGGADMEFYRTFMTALLNAQASQIVGDCLLTIIDLEDNGKVLFRGFLDNSEITISSRYIPNTLTLSAIDKSTCLDRKIRWNHYWENAKRKDIVNDLIQHMVSDGGINIRLLATEPENGNNAVPFSVNEEDGNTYREIIDKLLFEAPGHVLWYDHQNDGFAIKKIPVDVIPTATYRDVSYLVNDSLTTKSMVYDSDGVLLSYPNIKTKPNTNLYFENIKTSIDKNGKLVGEQIKPNGYFPADGDVKQIFQEFRIADRPYVSGETRIQNNDLKLLYAKDIEYQINAKPDLTLAPALPNIGWEGAPKLFPKKAQVLLHNANSVDSNLTMFSLTGTAVYIEYMNKFAIPKNCTKPEEYTATTISDEAFAKVFAQWYYNSRKFGQTTSQWSEPEGFSHLGEIVNVVHKESGVKMPHVIVQMTNQCAGGKSGTIRKISVTAISLFGWQSYEAGKVEAMSKGTSNSSVTIQSTEIAYQNSDSGTTVPAGEWETTPNPVAGKFQWTRTTVNYAPNGSTVSYSVSYIGIDGQKGDPADWLELDVSNTALKAGQSALISARGSGTVRTTITANGSAIPYAVINKITPFHMGHQPIILKNIVIGSSTDWVNNNPGQYGVTIGSVANDWQADHKYYHRAEFKYTTTDQTPKVIRYYSRNGHMGTKGISNPIAGTVYSNSIIVSTDRFLNERQQRVFSESAADINGVTTYGRMALVIDLTESPDLLEALAIIGITTDGQIKAWLDEHIPWFSTDKPFEIGGYITNLQTGVTYTNHNISVSDIPGGVRISINPNETYVFRYFNVHSRKGNLIYKRTDFSYVSGTQLDGIISPEGKGWDNAANGNYKYFLVSTDGKRMTRYSLGQALLEQELYTVYDFYTNRPEPITTTSFVFDATNAVTLDITADGLYAFISLLGYIAPPEIAIWLNTYIPLFEGTSPLSALLPSSLFITATSTTGLSRHSTISYVKDGTAGTDAITADISGGVMQIPVDADGKAVSPTSFNIAFKGWQGHVSKPCTAAMGALPQGMTATIGTDTITLTVAKDATLGGEIAGEVEINITCCGLVFAKKASWVKALDAAQIQGDIEELKVSRNDHEARLIAVKATADNAGNKAAVNETNIAATAEKLNSTVTRLTTAEGDISNAQSQINQQASEISLKVTAVQNGSEISGAKLEISSTEGGMIKLDADKVIAPGTISADKLKANILDIVNILLGEGGSIHSGIYDSQGNKTGSGKGVFIGADGVSKMTGLILDDGTIQADAIETVNEPLEDDPLVHKPFPATKDCHYPNPQLATWLKSKLTANVYKVASGTFGSDTVTGLMNTVSSADVSIGSGRTDKAVIKTFTTPAEYPTSIRIQASPISWHDEWEESSGRWVRLGSQQHTGPIPPEDTSPPSNPQDGDTYSEVSNVTSNIGPHPMYSWTETTYQYRVTTTTHTNDGNYNLKVTVNGEVKHDTNLSYDQILSLAPSSTIVIEYSGHANGYNFEGSWDVSYNNYRYYGKRLVYFNASKNPVTIPETGMANTALSVTVDGATITGGNGKTSWANLTPCSLFQGVLQKGAQLINLTAALSNDTISFSAQPYGESEVLITTAKSIMVDGSMLSIISSDGSSYSTYGKWYTSWSLSNCVPIEKGKGVYVRTLRPKKKEAGDNEPRRVGTDDDKFDEIISEKFIGYVNGTEEQSNEKLYKVWGAVVNPG